MKLNLQNTFLEITAGASEQFPRKPLPQISFSGRSNVGKSSLINVLLGRKKLARVSSMPGKTVTVNFYNVDQKLYIVDLPGYGFARRAAEDVEKWSMLTDGYFTSGYSDGRIKAIVQLIDLKVGITRDDETMLRFMNDMNLPYIIAATKCDKLNKTEANKNLEQIKNHGAIAKNTVVIPFSSLKGTGRDELWNEIYLYC